MRIKVILLFFLVSAKLSFAQQKSANSSLRSDNDRIIVISGGGARGAWGVGLLQGIMAHSGIHYSTAFGTSTGSLMAPFILTDDTAKLHVGYTGVTQSAIFNVNPFSTKVVNGQVESNIRWLSAVYRLITRKKTLGESQPLKNKIDNLIDADMFNQIKSRDLNLSVAVTNMSTGEVEIKSSKDYNYPDMCNWIWASANEPIWMSYYLNNGNYYVDGGVRDVIPLRQALEVAFDKKYTHLDVIINNSQNTLDPFPGKDTKFDWLGSLVRLLDVYNQGTVSNDIVVGNYMDKLHNLELTCGNSPAGCDTCEGVPLKITFYYMPSELAVNYRNELAFFPDQMAKLYIKGLEEGNVSENINDHLLKVEFNIINSKKNQMLLNKDK